MSKYPEIEFNIDVTNKNKVNESLKNNETGFALISIIPDEILLQKVELMNNYLFLIGPDTGNVEKFEFNEALFIFREEGSATKKL